ncbi:hypothetical protein NY08_1257 [Rhodococcus sp. B7740]|nr:hypothetical protein NY08_1257 [Rhodococcus sp. B7740]
MFLHCESGVSCWAQPRTTHQYVATSAWVRPPNLGVHKVVTGWARSLCVRAVPMTNV